MQVNIVSYSRGGNCIHLLPACLPTFIPTEEVPFPPLSKYIQLPRAKDQTGEFLFGTGKKKKTSIPPSCPCLPLKCWWKRIFVFSLTTMKYFFFRSSHSLPPPYVSFPCLSFKIYWCSREPCGLRWFPCTPPRGTRVSCLYLPWMFDQSEHSLFLFGNMDEIFVWRGANTSSFGAKTRVEVLLWICHERPTWMMEGNVIVLSQSLKRSGYAGRASDHILYHLPAPHQEVLVWCGKSNTSPHVILPLTKSLKYTGVQHPLQWRCTRSNFIS